MRKNQFLRWNFVFFIVMFCAAGCERSRPEAKTSTPEQQDKRGLSYMSQKTSVEENLRNSGQEQVSGLAQTLASELREPIHSAVQLWLGRDPEMSNKAMLLLLGVGELAIVPLTEAQPPTPADKIWSMRMAVDAELAMRKKIIARVNVLLDDKTVIPMARIPRAEQVAPPRRVCDEAYLLMRRLVHMGEDEIAAQAQESLFLDLLDAQKDAIIRKARESNGWNRVLNGKDVEP